MQSETLTESSSSVTCSSEIVKVHTDDFDIIEEMQTVDYSDIFQKYKKIAKKISECPTPYLIAKALQSAHTNGYLQMADEVRKFSQEHYGKGIDTRIKISKKVEKHSRKFDLNGQYTDKLV